MKKIIIISAIFIFAAAIGIGIYSSQNTTKGSDILKQNIEVLSQWKYYPMPCCGSKGDTCTYEAIGGDGKRYEVSLQNMKNC